MKLYLWEGRDQDGAVLSGEIEAPDVQTVFNQLRSQQITPNVRKIRPKGSGLNRELRVPSLRPPVKDREIVIFTRQLATMIDAGLPIIQALDILSRQGENSAFRNTLRAVRAHVEGGGTLADGLAKHPKVFNELFCNMIAAGERGGSLDSILRRLTIHLEKGLKLSREIKTALIYPAVVLSATALITVTLLMFVVPIFADLFAEFGATLPLPTQIVISISEFLGHHLFSITAASLAAGLLLVKLQRTPRGKTTIERLLLKLPVVGAILRAVALARFTRTLGITIASGVPIVEALWICGRTAGNSVVTSAVQRVQDAVSEGKSMVEPMQAEPVFPPLMVEMIRIGESTGSLEAILQKLADLYEDDVDNAVASLKQLIEPVLVLLLGIIVGVLAISLYLPVLKLGSVVE
jgi:type IV pilus assembly protein PilC